MIKVSNKDRRILFRVLSSLPVWEGTIIGEHVSSLDKPFYTVRRKLDPTELGIIGTLSKGKYVELPTTLRFGNPVIPQGETETHMDYWVDQEEVLSFIETDENGEVFYAVVL